MKAMVLAAGVGSRLEPLTTQLPKPMVPVANVPVMEHLVNLLVKHGFNEICANLHYLPEKLTSYFGDGEKFGAKFHFITEAKLSGDAGGVRACREYLQDGTFVVIMGDLLTDADIARIVKEHKAKKAIASIAIKEMDDVSRFGVVVTDENGFITGFQEKPKQEDALSKYISTGIYVLEPEVFEHIPSTGEYGFGRQLFPDLVAKKLPVLGIRIDEYWSDVGTIKQYRESNYDALTDSVHVKMPGTPQKRNGNEVWICEGAKIDPSVIFDGTVQVGRNVSVGPGTRFSGTVVIGDNVAINAGSSISDSIIWSGSQIGANAQIKNSVIGLNCRIDSDSDLDEATIVESSTPVVASKV